MKILTQPFLLAFSLFLLGVSSHAQTPPPLSFYPYRAGNVWQYRDAFNNEIFWTRYNDSDSLGNDGAIFIRGRRVPDNTTFREKIDTAANVFFWYGGGPPPTDTLYNLNATVGQSWRGWDSDIRITLAGIQSGIVFGVPTTLKRFRFTLAQPPPREPLVFREDYLASGFGLVQSYFEPGLFISLAGAIIDGVRWGIIVGVDGDREIAPSEFTLHQNHPNPFNPITKIAFDLPHRALVRLAVFDILGREVALLVHSEQERGSNSIVFDGESLASGVYFYRLQVGGSVLTKKMIVQK